MLNWENYSQGQWSNGTNLEAAAKEKVLKSFSCKGTYVTHVRQTLSGLIQLREAGKEVLRKWRAGEKMKRPNIQFWCKHPSAERWDLEIFWGV